MREPSPRVVAVEHLTLDGVYQAPARVDEDTRNGFTHGGWAMAGDDPEMQRTIGRYMVDGWSLLVGRTTYEDLYEGWRVRQPSSPMTHALTAVQKFVVSQGSAYELGWENSTLLSGDGVDNVAKLKNQHEKPLITFGSGVLVRSLLKEAVLDELVLMIHPLVLGTGYRMFEGSPPAKLGLAHQFVTATGVIIATYRGSPSAQTGLS